MAGGGLTRAGTLTGVGTVSKVAVAPTPALPARLPAFSSHGRSQLLPSLCGAIAAACFSSTTKVWRCCAGPKLSILATQPSPVPVGPSLAGWLHHQPLLTGGQLMLLLLMSHLPVRTGTSTGAAVGRAIVFRVCQGGFNREALDSLCPP